MAVSAQKIGCGEGVLSAVVNTVLFAVKLRVGMAAGSVAMTADAWHTLSDTLTSVIVIFGFWISGKPGDTKHPFGHGRAELISSLVIAVLLGVVGFDFLKESVLRLRDGRAASFHMIAAVVFAVSVVVKEALAQFSMWAGRKTDSQSLIADGWHHRSDAIASALIVAGGLLGKFFWWIDGVLGAGVSLLILYAAIDILKTAADRLMGEQLTVEDEKTIRETLNKVAPDAANPHHFHMHRYGNHREVTMHVRLDGDMTVREGHAIAATIESEVKRAHGIDLTVHVEPPRQDGNETTADTGADEKK